MIRRALGALTVLLVLLSPGVPRAQEGLCPGITATMQAVGFETLTVSTVAIGFTASAWAGRQARIAQVSVEDQSLRYRTIGTPTASVGHVATAGTSFAVCGVSVASFRAIRKDGSDSKMTVTYYDYVR